MVELRRSSRLANKKVTETVENTTETIESEDAIKRKKLKTDTTTSTKTKTKENLNPGDDKPEDAASEASTELEVGDEAPDVTLSNQDGKDISLREVVSKNKIVVIFVYPRASTPGCTRQACGFRDNYTELKKHAAVFGLSADNESSQKRFQTKQNLPYDLLCDPERKLIGLLGAKKTPKSGSIRSHFVFFEGKLRFKRIKVSPEVSVRDSKLEVLQLAEELENRETQTAGGQEDK